MPQNLEEGEEVVDFIETHLTTIEQREKILGYRPQKEIIYNALLPYSERLDKESCDQLAEIKSQIGRAVLLRDVKIAGIHWIGQLSKYIRLNGMKFSLEDHINFIQLLFEVLCIPGLQYSLVQKYAVVLTALLKKKELIPRNSLILPWRPLYKLIDNVVNSSFDHHGMVFFPDNIETTLKHLIRVSRVYFPAESTKEMLDEWRPLMCPFDIKMGQAMYNFEMFLPTFVYPEEHDKTFKLWFDEFMGFYYTSVNTPSWELHMVNLFTRLAQDCAGYVNWEPYMNQIFTRILRNFNLPVGTRKIEITRMVDCYEINNISRWIVYMLSPESEALDRVSKLFKALESYYHPSNHGHYSSKLLKLLSRLSLELVKRLQREKWRSTKGFKTTTDQQQVKSKKQEEQVILAAPSKTKSWRAPWQPEIPTGMRLTEDDITRFVTCMSTPLMSAMFSKIGSSDAATTFKNLSTVRPEIVIPPLLECTYSALETLTEPHRLTACLQCTASVVRSMLVHPHRYPEGPSHVIPLLRLSLPGIDPNDIKKSLMTFQLITSLASLIPIVDCSEAHFHYKDLTIHEEELCSATAEFEGVILQYFDRVISLIENSAHQHVRTDSTTQDRMSNEEIMLELCLLSSTNSLLQQTSLPIFKEALKKLHNLALGSIFEIRVAGRFTSKLVKAASKVHPELVLPMFVPHCCNLLIKRLQAEDMNNEEHLDDEILWHLLLLSELVASNGKYLLPHCDLLTSTLDATLHLKCKDAAELAGNLLRNMLRSLSSIFAVDYRCTMQDWNAPLFQFLPIREWGKSSDIFNLGMQWHQPSQEEKQFAHQLLEKYLMPQLEKIKFHCSNSSNNKMDREDLLKRLNIIHQCIFGASALLPAWEDTPVALVDSPVQLSRFATIASNDEKGLTFQNNNIRLVIADHMKLLLNQMFSSDADDTKSLLVVIKIISSLMHMFSASKDEFDGRWKVRHHVKHFMENKLLGKKKHIRALIVDRIQLQHDLRSTNQSMKHFTKYHQEFYLNLFQLSISRYMEVRKSAQAALNRAFRVFAYSYKVLLDDVVALLQDKPNVQVEHHQFKGALYVIYGESKQSLVSRRNWEVMKKLWPALVLTPHCEKPSVNLLYDLIIERLHKDIETTEIHLKVSQPCLELAERFWQMGGGLKCSVEKPTEQEVSRAAEEEEKRNESNLKSYLELVESLVAIAENTNLFWKFQQVCFELLSLLIRQDVALPSSAVELFVGSLTNNIINIRKISLLSVSALLKQQKRPHFKATLDPYCSTLPFRISEQFRLDVTDSELEKYKEGLENLRIDTKESEALVGCLRKSTVAPVLKKPTHRPPNNNRWLMYSRKEVPATEEEWNEFVFINKTHIGYYDWPKTLTYYKPSDDQPKLGRSRSELSKYERPIYDAFTNEDFVRDFIKYISMEEQKGKDSFHPKNFLFFKGLFRNFDDTVLPLIQQHVETLVSDTSHESQESNHRCAAEIIAGLLRGSKHWSFKKREQMWSWLIPVIKQVIHNLSVENFKDWGTCIATSSENQDPRKLAPLFDLLMENPLNEIGGSFGDSSRLYLIQGILSQQEWRVPELLHKLLNFLSQHFRHLYKNVRDRIGSLLINIFLFDVSFYPGFPMTLNPQLNIFLELPVSQLLPLAFLGEEGESLASIALTKDHKLAETLVEKLTTLDRDRDLEKSSATIIKPVDVSNVAMQQPPPTVANSGVKSSAAQRPVQPHVPPDADAAARLNDPSSSSNRSSCRSSVFTTEEKQKSNIRLCKTILKGLQGVYTRLFHADHHGALKLLPVMAALESYTSDPELSRECAITLAIISTGLLSDTVIDSMLDAVEKVSRMTSWHARSAILSFLQRLVFGNLFLLHRSEVVERVRRILIERLLDEQVEVRELAGVTLSGFFQCGYLPVNEEILTYFKKLGSTKISKKRPAAQQVMSVPSNSTLKPFSKTEAKNTLETSASAPLPNFLGSLPPDKSSGSDVVQQEPGATVDPAVLKCHAGIIGMCACVSAAPYDVPDYVPDLLVVLSSHLNDPQPIQMTVKKMLASFKRTHHENWHDHKQKFTDDQLVILTELLVSPNYYA